MLQVEFQENPSNIPHKREIVFNSMDDELVKQYIFHLLKEIILEVEPVEGQIFSNNFLQEKEDGSQRVILNLKYLNETIDQGCQSSAFRRNSAFFFYFPLF